MNWKNKYFGDRKFYKMLFKLVLPMLAQNIITNFVGMVDNIMVGQIGTDQMSGVAVANQLIFVFEIAIFGLISGASIFGAQFYGSGNDEGYRNTFRFKLVYGLIGTLIGLAVFGMWGSDLIGLYLHSGSSTGNAADTLGFGKQYLLIMMTGLLPYVLTQVYASSLREMGKTVIPMNAGITAILLNMVLNYILIFGKFGAPVMGVAGAAIATVISRYAEMLIILIVVHKEAELYPFAHGAYRTLIVPAQLQKQIILKGTPLFVNEIMWACGQAILNQSYSMRGLAVVAGINISSTIGNLFNVLFIAMGGAVSIIIGQLLGAGKMEEARETDRKLIVAAVIGCVTLGCVMAVIAPFFPSIYRTTQEVRALATQFILILALFLPVDGFMHTCYFTLRSGGKTVITMFFDCGFVWLCSIPLVRILTIYTGLPVVTVFFCCRAAELIKASIGTVLLKKGIWLNNIVK